MTPPDPRGRPGDEDATATMLHPTASSGPGTATGDETAPPPPTATAPDREPPLTPPPAPPAAGEAGRPPSGPREPARRRGGGWRLPILGIVLVLLGLGLLLERLVPGFELGDLWPYGSIALGLALVVASLRPSRDRSA